MILAITLHVYGMAIFISSLTTQHEYYNGNALGFPNDIATVQLSSPLTFNSYISNITIDEDPNNSWEGQQCWLTGWGRKSG